MLWFKKINGHLCQHSRLFSFELVHLALALIGLNFKFHLFCAFIQIVKTLKIASTPSFVERNILFFYDV